jgi:hypothetical protein
VKQGAWILTASALPDDPSFAAPILPDPFGDWRRPQLHPVSQPFHKWRLTHQQSGRVRFHWAGIR